MRLVLLGVLLVLSAAGAQGSSSSSSQTSLAVGVAGNIVIDAWNPVRLVTRDVPAGTRLHLTIDQGSLRQGSIPQDVVLPVPGGAGVSVVEGLVYVRAFSGISWALRGPDSVLASGSLVGRDQDDRQLDIVLSREPGRYLSAFGVGTRVVDVAAADLPLEVAAYDGVRTLIIDGTTTAPRLEAVAAAAAAGTVVVLHGRLPASHRELELLVTASDTAPGGLSRTPLGAGVILTTSGAASDAVAAALSFPGPDRAGMLASLTSRPLVDIDAGPSQWVVLIAAGLFSLLALAMLRWFAAPGLVGATLLAMVLSFVGWSVFRPPEPQVTAAASLALIGGELATTTEVREVLTLPAAVVDAPATARPLLPQPYSLDPLGTHFNLPRWRSVTLVLAPVVTDPAIRLQGTSLVNTGSAVLHDVAVVGLGPQPDIGPGRSVALIAAEEGPLNPVYRDLFTGLSPGTVVALSDCETGCIVWIAPDLVTELVESL